LKPSDVSQAHGTRPAVEAAVDGAQSVSEGEFEGRLALSYERRKGVPTVGQSVKEAKQLLRAVDIDDAALDTDLDILAIVPHQATFLGALLLKQRHVWVEEIGTGSNEEAAHWDELEIWLAYEPHKKEAMLALAREARRRLR